MLTVEVSALWLMALMCQLTPGVQVLSRGLGDQQMRIKSMKMENKELRQRLADDATLWQDLQHDLTALNAMPEGKGRRQEVSQTSGDVRLRV